MCYHTCSSLVAQAFLLRAVTCQWRRPRLALADPAQPLRRHSQL